MVSDQLLSKEMEVIDLSLSPGSSLSLSASEGKAVMKLVSLDFSGPYQSLKNRPIELPKERVIILREAENLIPDPLA